MLIFVKFEGKKARLISIWLDPQVSELGGENVIFFKNAKISKKKLGLQHQVFPGGHPSKY